MHPNASAYGSIEERLGIYVLDLLRRRFEERLACQERWDSAYAIRISAILDRVEDEIVARNLEEAA